MLLTGTIKDFLRKGDLVLFSLCLAASAFGLALVYSATRYDETLHSYFQKQILFDLLGLILFVLISAVDVELIVEKSWKFLFVFGTVLILLLIPFGVGSETTGNQSWLYLPGVPFGIQPAEVVKLVFVLLLARTLDRQREYGISRPLSIVKMGGLTIYFCGLIVAVSQDFGMVLVYLSIFVIMAFIAGVKLRWFLLAGGGGVAAVALAWSHLPTRIRTRFLVVLDHSYDPQGVGWHQTRSLLAIGSGKLTGMGYLNGMQTQSASSTSLPARHTDFIFAVCGEELGMIGCCAVIALLLAIVIRCVWVSRRAKSYLSAYVAMGFAGMLMIQAALNIGMCLYVAPVVGLTLPLFSYGGSSTLTIYAAMGIVNGIKMRSLPSWLKDRSHL